MVEESLSTRLSSWLVSCRESGIPERALDVAQRCVLDWLGSAIAGTKTKPGKILLAYARSQPQGDSSVIGIGLQKSAEVAAFVNGGLSHIIEMDDVDRGSVLHPGTVVIPAALAVAEREQTSGADFLSAIIAGYEVAIRIGEAVGKRHYYFFHNTSTCGVFGAAAAASWLQRLGEKQTMCALGNAGTQASGLWEFNQDGDMSKHLHAGRAAANGVLAADLASHGFTGARRILEGGRGFFKATAPDANPNKVLDDLSYDRPNFKINGVSFKPHPSCRHTHPSIDAAKPLYPKIIGRNIKDVLIQTYQAAIDLCNNPEPLSISSAKFSLQYCTSLALLKGQVRSEDFTNNGIKNPSVADLISKIALIADPLMEANYPDKWSARVRIILADGESIESFVDHPKGDPENPLSAEELIDKFRQLVALAGKQQQVDPLIFWATSLKEAPRITLADIPS